MLTDSNRHDGMVFRFGGAGHRIDFVDLSAAAVWLYPQHEVLKDLVAMRLPRVKTCGSSVTAASVEDAASDRPRVLGTDAEGQPFEIEADFVVGADGSRSVARAAVTGSSTGGYFREYPFAWFGILCDAPPSAEEPVYSNSPNGFALISHRSATVQRMYFQCDPDVDPESYTEAQLWEELQSRIPGLTLIEGPIFQRDALRFQLRRARAAQGSGGDHRRRRPHGAADGREGLESLVADVLVLEKALRALLLEGDERPLDLFPETALRRIWKAQHFSWWMTSMLDVAPDASDFDRFRQLGELHSVVESRAGQTYLAEAYTGWPLET